MTKLCSQIAEALHILQINTLPRERFLKAAEQFSEADQEKIFLFLMGQIQNFMETKEEYLKKLKNVYKKGIKISEQEEQSSLLESIEAKLTKI